MQRILWITGRLPWPLFSGDALYTAGLLQAARRQGWQVTVIGLPRTADTSIARLSEIASLEWQPVLADPAPAWQSLASTLPKDAFSLFPREFSRQLSRLLERQWDWVVFDHARSAGGLDQVLARGSSRIAYLAHNVESKVRHAVAAGVAAGPAKLPYVLDAEKYRRLENRLVRAADTVFSITEEDADDFRASGATAYRLPPVYLGPKVAHRIISADTPRRVLLLGSFEWVAKQKNLMQFLQSAGPILAKAAVGVDIVGAIRPKLRSWLEAQHPGAQLLGPLPDARPAANSVRAAVIPEELGGGMKLKTLDYVFMRLPMFSLKSGVLGLPSAARNAAFTAETFEELGNSIVSHIDDLAELNRRQDAAFQACEQAFCHAETASAMKNALDKHSLVLN